MLIRREFRDTLVGMKHTGQSHPNPLSKFRRRKKDVMICDQNLMQISHQPVQGSDVTMWTNLVLCSEETLVHYGTCRIELLSNFDKPPMLLLGSRFDI